MPASLTVEWAMAHLVVSDALFEHGAPGAIDLVSRELRRGVIAATDRAFLAMLAVGAPDVPATSDLTEDILTAADEMALDGSARLILIAPTTSVRHAALKADVTGARVLPELNINGGTIGGVRVLASDYLPSLGSPADPTAILVDASQVAVADGELEMDIARHASYQLSDTPSAGAQQQTNLWQTNSRAIRVRRRVGFAKVRENAACLISGVAW